MTSMSRHTLPSFPKRRKQKKLMELYATLSDGCCLRPMYEDDLAKIRCLSRDRGYCIKILEARNIRLHRKYFALINTAWECLDEQWRVKFRQNIDCFRRAITLLCGFTEPSFNPRTGEWTEIPRSISFESMSESEFQQLYDLTIRQLFLTFLPRDSARQKAFYAELKDY